MKIVTIRGRAQDPQVTTYAPDFGTVQVQRTGRGSNRGASNRGSDAPEANRGEGLLSSGWAESCYRGGLTWTAHRLSCDDTERMSTATDPAKSPASETAPTGRLHAAAALRIVFGLVWCIDATFKWLPGFISGQTLSKELGKASKVHTPVIHQWIELWHSVALAAPHAFALGTAIIETLIALGMLTGLLSNLVFVGSAIFSFGIWSAAEAFGLPWTRPGITDLGPSVGYIIAALALLLAAGGATWSLDAVLRPRLGRLAWLSG